MKVAEEIRDGVLVLSPRGRLDGRTTTSFEHAAVACVRAPAGATRVVVNCAEVRYINCSGLWTLLNLARELKGLGGEFALCECRAFVQEVFRVSGLDQVFEILPTVEEAVKRVEPVRGEDPVRGKDPVRGGDPGRHRDENVGPLLRKSSHAGTPAGRMAPPGRGPHRENGPPTSGSAPRGARNQGRGRLALSA